MPFSVSQGRHGIMILESMAVMSSPKQDNNTILIQDHPVAQVKPPCSQSEHTCDPRVWASQLPWCSNVKDLCCTFPGIGGSSFYPETLSDGENLHCRCQFSRGVNHPGSSHLVSVEGTQFLFFNINSFLWQFSHQSLVYFNNLPSCKISWLSSAVLTNHIMLQFTVCSWYTGFTFSSSLCPSGWILQERITS